MSPSCHYRGLRLQRNYERSQGEARGWWVPEIRSIQSQAARRTVFHLLDQLIWRRPSSRACHKSSHQRELECLFGRNKAGPRKEPCWPLHGDGKQNNFKVYIQGVIPIVFNITVWTLILVWFVMFCSDYVLALGRLMLLLG